MNAVQTKDAPSAVRDYGRLLDDSLDRISQDSVSTFVPHKGTILVKPDPPDTKSQNGIIFPDRAIQQKLFGTVLAVSSTDGDYDVGDRVLFRARAGTGMEFPDVGACLLLQYCGEIDDEILGKFRRE